MNNRIDVALAPTLLIGLGGQGSKIVARVSEKANEQQKKFISFVVFDTDVNELRKIKKLNPEVKTIQTSARQTVGEYLNNDPFSRKNWFPIHNILNNKTPSEGAGQVRAISRLVMDNAIRCGDLEPLHQAIDDLYGLSPEESQQATRIVIVSSLAGGTGSGLILPVSMYVKNYLVTKCNLSASIIRGFFLLPEVMDSVISAESERSNLYCNAYATIREIDAFMQKGFKTLDSRYDDLKFAVPKAGNGEEVDYYDHSPFDFCFLFSRQNVESEKMHSKDDLLEHAANCIYAQSIGPTNSRQNSSEDNTILERVRSKGRNNYCGAGASTLEYPYEDVKSYIAYNWAKNAINNNWLEIDNEFIEKNKMNDEAKGRGSVVIEKSRGEHYTDIVESKDLDDQPFAKQIIRDSTLFDSDGFTIIESKWVRYEKSLKQYVKKAINTHLNKAKVISNEIEGYYDQPKQDYEFAAECFETINTKINLLKNFSDDATKRVADGISDTLYASSRKPISSVSSKDDYKIEAMFVKTEHEIYHPCTIRYMLYKTETYLETKINKLNKLINQANDDWQNYIKNDFEYKEETLSPSQFITKFIEETKGFNKKKRIRSEIESKIDVFTAIVNSINEKTEHMILKMVYTKAIAYIHQLSLAFEQFFDILAYEIPRIDKRIEAIEKKYPDLDAKKPVRYVCSTKECLEYLSAKAVNTAGTTSLPGDLCANIYDQVLAYAMVKDRKDAEDILSEMSQSKVEKEDVLADKDIKINKKNQQIENYFQNLFNNTIMRYWRSEVATKCNALINMDIIEAIEKEGEILEHHYLRNDKKLYVEKVIREAKNLALPFIDAPMNDQKRIIASCCFNPVLLDSDFDDRVQLVTKEFVDYGGVTSSLTSKYSVVFFLSIYNLKATDFRCFAPPTKAETLQRKPGNYFEAYYDRVNKISAEDAEAEDVTPHIHKAWHLVSVLPELNPDYQIKLELDVCKAFVLGFVYDFVDYHHRDKMAGSSIYELKFNQYTSSLKDYSYLNKLTVRGGEYCERLHEVFEALTLNPVVCNAINDIYHEYMENQKTRRVAFTNNEFFKNLSKINISEYKAHYAPDGKGKISLFTLVLLYKISCPSSKYHHVWSNRMIQAICELIKENIRNFENENEVDNYYALLLLKQGKLLIENLRVFEESDDNAICACPLDSLTENVINSIYGEIKNAGDYDHSEEFKALWKTFKEEAEVKAKIKGEAIRRKFLEDSEE